MEIILNELNCKRCGHCWVPRKTDVRQCPFCKSAYWNEIKIKHEKCLVPSCKNGGRLVKGYCEFHYGRHLRGVDLNRPKGLKGNLNPRWNGGVSEYPNHSKMKKQRLVVLEQADYKCFYCGQKANQIHHIDGSKHNHELHNLTASCVKCNQKPEHRTSKYKRIYGMTQIQLASSLNVTTHYVRKMHKNGILMQNIPKEKR